MTMTHDGDADEEMVEINLKLWELERDHEDDELYPDEFIAEFTAFPNWDEFKRRLAATDPDKRNDFVSTTTLFSCYEEMEGMALERLVARKVPLLLQHQQGEAWPRLA